MFFLLTSEIDYPTTTPTPLYCVLHVTLGFKQRTERGQWRIACGSGWLSANTQQRWVFLKGPVPIYYCLHTLKSSHKIYCYSLSNWTGEAFHLMHCASQIVAPFQRLPNSISFPSIFHHTPWALKCFRKVL